MHCGRRCQRTVGVGFEYTDALSMPKPQLYTSHSLMRPRWAPLKLRGPFPPGLFVHSNPPSLACTQLASSLKLAHRPPRALNHQSQLPQSLSLSSVRPTMHLGITPLLRVRTTAKSRGLVGAEPCLGPYDRPRARPGKHWSRLSPHHSARVLNLSPAQPASASECVN